MTKKEYEQVIKIIEKYMHVDYLSNGSCKNVLDSHGLIYVKEDLKEMIKEKEELL